MTPQTFPFGHDSGGLDLTAHGLWRTWTKNGPVSYVFLFIMQKVIVFWLIHC